jgi:hypothetical protein
MCMRPQALYMIVRQAVKSFVGTSRGELPGPMCVLRLMHIPAFVGGIRRCCVLEFERNLL